MLNNALDVKTLDEYAMDLPIHKSGVRGEGNYYYNANVEVGPLVHYVAELCTQLLSMHSITDIPDIEKYFSSLVYYRVLQIQGKTYKDLRDVAIPNFFFPVLASLGKYDDPMRAMQITPHMEYDPMTPEEMTKTSFVLRAAGVATTLGLPVRLSSEIDDMYRVELVNGEFRVSGEQVSNHTLLVRTMVNIEFLKDVFAAPRTRYMSVEDAKPAWDSIVLRTWLSATQGR
jgi:hypothetical protein